jgi:GNAT superfamily N-acetyltransferase
MTYTLAGDEHLQGILDVQAANLRFTKSPDVEQDQGFVTVHHSYDILKAMNDKAQHVVAVDHGCVVAYALAMTIDFREVIPELRAMFAMLDSLEVDGKALGDTTYIVMGQVCVAEAHRGRGVFQALYQYYFEVYKAQYEYIVTEIALRNTRSMHVHKKLGFREIHTYAEEGSEDWAVVVY